MRDTMTEFSFCDWFQKSEERKNQFSYEGLRALYEYLVNLEDDIGEEFEFDPIALCCEYTEYENLEDFKKQHDWALTLDEIRLVNNLISKIK